MRSNSRALWCFLFIRCWRVDIADVAIMNNAVGVVRVYFLNSGVQSLRKLLPWHWWVRADRLCQSNNQRFCPLLLEKDRPRQSYFRSAPAPSLSTKGQWKLDHLPNNNSPFVWTRTCSDREGSRGRGYQTRIIVFCGPPWKAKSRSRSIPALKKNARCRATHRRLPDVHIG
jgi:hypothetical protein